jgi:hypothetical protein
LRKRNRPPRKKFEMGDSWLAGLLPYPVGKPTWVSARAIDYLGYATIRANLGWKQALRPSNGVQDLLVSSFHILPQALTPTRAWISNRITSSFHSYQRRFDKSGEG